MAKLCSLVLPLLQNKADLEKFKRLGISSALELAVFVPAIYENRELLSEALIGQTQVLDVTVKSIHQTSKFLRVSFFSHNLGTNVDGMIFNPRPFHRNVFRDSAKMLIHGKIQKYNGTLQIAQPKVIESSGGIVAIYRTDLRTDSMRRLIEKYVTLENLDVLPDDVIKNIMSLHYPTAEFVNNFIKVGEYGGKYLYALKFVELYTYMFQLRKKRRYFKASHVLNAEWQSWRKTLPFNLTDDQKRAIDKIEKDFSSGLSSRRIVVGDVGSGKTMVILASIIMAHPYKSILMAPTTLLANQLFEEAQKFLPDEFKIVLVTNEHKKEDLAEFDVLIGTHALLYRDLPNVALVMVDEQHRFGTAQRNMLEKLTNNDANTKPHYIQFSATPIPRTQAMIDSNFIDVSLIEQTPFKRDILTKVIQKQHFRDLLSHITLELERNHQVLIVYPLVEQSDAIEYQSLEEAKDFWIKRFENVAVTHGKDKNKSEVLKNFKDSGNILLATTVVEVGISLPRLSTVVIVGAERLGLATLHQLRGRVSRTGLKGYCYLFTNLQKSARLESFSQSNNGFEIAALDLKFRQSGDLLSGNMQSGKSFKWVNLGEDEKVIKDVQKLIPQKR